MSPLDRMAWLVSVAAADLRPGAYRAAILLAWRCSKDNGTARPSVEGVGRDAGMSESTARRGIRDLERAGFLRVEHTPGRSCCTYTLAKPGRAAGVDSSNPVNLAGAQPCQPCTPTPAELHANPCRVDTRTRTITRAEQGEIPAELASLELYRSDLRLVGHWPQLLAAWTAAHPRLDISTEIAKAHAWEVANPTKRKKDRAAFLGRWLGRAKLAPEPERDDYSPDPAFLAEIAAGSPNTQETTL